MWNGKRWYLFQLLKWKTVAASWSGHPNVYQLSPHTVSMAIECHHLSLVISLIYQTTTSTLNPLITTCVPSYLHIHHQGDCVGHTIYLSSWHLSMLSLSLQKYHQRNSATLFNGYTVLHASFDIYGKMEDRSRTSRPLSFFLANPLLIHVYIPRSY